MKKLRAMVEIDVTLTDEEWQKIQDDYAYIWRDEIKAGDVPEKIGEGDAWVGLLTDYNTPDNFQINWDARTDEELLDDD